MIKFTQANISDSATQPTNQGFFQYRQGIVTYYIISNSLYSDIDVYDRYFSLG